MSELAAGRLDRAVFLQHFGWRGSHEMELAEPRWSEDPAALEQTASGVRQPPDQTGSRRPVGLGRVASAPRPKASSRRKTCQPLQTDVVALQTYLGLRETAKHYLMRGYALIRRILLELDRRYRLARRRLLS